MKERDCTIRVADTVKLICVFVIACAKSQFLTTWLIWAIRKLSLGFWPPSDTNWVVHQAGWKLAILGIHLGSREVLKYMK